MAGKLLWSGRVLFVFLLITQLSLLAQYLVEYEGKSDFYWLLLPSLPIAIAWVLLFFVPSDDVDRMSWLWIFWALYSSTLAVAVGLTFGLIVIPGKLDSSSFYGPNTLKSLLCITPVLMLLLNSVSDEFDYDSPLLSFFFTVTVDLFDGIEMLEVLLEEGECNLHAIPSEKLQIAILIFVCLFFFVSFFELAQVKFEDYEIYDEIAVKRRVFCFHATFRGLLNVSFLVHRIILWVKYRRDAAIFITKNVISIIYLVMRAFSVFLEY